MSERPGSRAAAIRFSGLGHGGFVAVVLSDGVVELRFRIPALVVEGPGAVEIVARDLQHGLGLGKGGLEHLDLAGPLQFGLGVGEPCVRLGDARFRRRGRGLLLGAFQREDRVALAHAVAFLDGKRFDAAPLLGTDENEIGLHVARELALIVRREGGEHEDASRPRRGCR